MRSPVIPVLVVIAGLALAWLWWTRESDAPPKYATTAVATANRIQPAPPASSIAPTSASAAGSASRTAPAAAPTMPTHAADAAPQATSPSSIAEPATAMPPRAGDPSRPLSSRESVAAASDGAASAPAADATPTSDDAAANASTAGETANDALDAGAGTATTSTEPSPGAPSGNDAASPGSDASDDAASSDDAAGGDENESGSASVAEPPKAEPPDAGHAADLVADWMADTDNGADSREGLAGAQQSFDREANDPAWAESTKHEIETTFSAWLDTLPDRTRSHVRLLHVECRLSYCQLLGVQNGEHSDTAINATAVADFFHAQPWWNEQRFVESSFFGKADEASGYYLFQLYLRRNTTPGS
jgi:hypothetical protein